MGSGDVHGRMNDLDASAPTDAHGTHEVLEKIQQSHQWDPNLPQEKADAIAETLRIGEPETMMEMEKEFAAKSPYEEVQAAVRDIDQGEPASTFRSWFLGLIAVTIVSGVNMFLSMRTPSISIPAVVVILITYPIGCFSAKVLPTRSFKVFGMEWTFNPGPFTVKEHTVIALMANITSGYPYSTNALEALQARSLYNFNLGWGFALMFTLSSQVLGIALSGMFRRFLVWPAAMIWPSQFGTTSLLYTLHDKSQAVQSEAIGWSMSRYRWFMYVATGMFIWYWIPGVLWQGSVLSIFDSRLIWLSISQAVNLCVRHVDQTKQCRHQPAVRWGDRLVSDPDHI